MESAQRKHKIWTRGDSLLLTSDAITAWIAKAPVFTGKNISGCEDEGGAS